jgi:hypothetical protein
MDARDFCRAGHSRIAQSFLLAFLRAATASFAVLSSAYAEDTRLIQQVWLNPGFFSWHFDRSLDLREDNWGIGVEVAFAPDHAAMVGNFINSDGDRSRYGAYLWRPLHWRPYGIDVHAGIAVGAFDGYQRVNSGGWFGACPCLPSRAATGGSIFRQPTIEDRVNGLS